MHFQMVPSLMTLDDLELL